MMETIARVASARREGGRTVFVTDVLLDVPDDCPAFPRILFRLVVEAEGKRTPTGHGFRVPHFLARKLAAALVRAADRADEIAPPARRERTLEGIR